MKNLKPVPADKKKSLGKLPTDVRNKMGYAKKGSMMKAKKGKMITGKKEEDDVSKYVKSIKLPDAKDVRDVVNKKAMGGEMKKGYGAARTSGMGLQDENLIPGKSMDYYKDLM